MENLISVVIPIYNMELYLKECIESVLNQTYTNLEILLIDDGSTDSSLEICKKYAALDRRIVVIHQENKGLSGARNTGIKKAHGKYLAFVDSDDYINKMMIEKLYCAINKSEGVELAVCGIQCIYDHNFQGEKQEVRSIIKDEECDAQIAIERLFSPLAESWQYVVSCNKLYKSSLFDNVCFLESYIHEDEIIIHRILGQCKKIVFISDILYYYRQRNGSITAAEYTAQHLDYFKAIEDRIIYFKNTNRKKLLEKSASQFWYGTINRYYIFQPNDRNNFYLKRFLKSYRRIVVYLLTKANVCWKERIAILLFAISPQLCKKLLKLK